MVPTLPTNDDTQQVVVSTTDEPRVDNYPDGAAYAGWVCSLLSTIFGGVAFLFCPLLFATAGLILGIVGVVMARNKTLAIIGIALSAVAILVTLVLLAQILNRLRSYY